MDARTHKTDTTQRKPLTECIIREKTSCKPFHPAYRPVLPATGGVSELGSWPDALTRLAGSRPARKATEPDQETAIVGMGPATGPYDDSRLESYSRTAATC